MTVPLDPNVIRDRDPPVRLRRALIALCITEITSWGVLYYAFPVMLVAVSRDTGWSTAAAMGAFSAGAITAALAGVITGRLIDRHGPRPVMTVGSLLAIVAVASIAAAPNLPCFYAAWVLAGVAQSAVLYPPAFAAITIWWGPDRVRALTTLTLAGGLASTVFAPLTAALLDYLTWRETYLTLAVVLAVITVPLHALCLTPPWMRTRRQGRPSGRDAHAVAVLRSRRFLTLTTAMAMAAFGLYATTVNLVALLTSRGMSTHLAALGLGLCGAGQFLGRLGYPLLSRRIGLRTRAVGVVAMGAGAILGLGLLTGPPAVLIGAAITAGALRGLFTLLQATAVSDRWGTRSFGRINGVFAAPITIAIALAPGGGILLADLIGGYSTSLTILAILTFTAAAGVALATPSDARRHPPVAPSSGGSPVADSRPGGGDAV
jgi:MFS family permease